MTHNLPPVDTGSSALSIGVVKSSDWPSLLKQEWTRLIESAPTATIFQTWEWQSAWWNQYRGTQRPYILTVRQGKNLVGLMPMAVSSGLWRALRPMGAGKSDYLNPISRCGLERQVAAAVVDHIQSSNDFDLVDFQMIREDQEMLSCIEKGEVKPLMPCLLIELPPTWDEYLGTLRRTLRQDINRFRDESSRYGKADIRAFGPDDVDQGVRIMFDVHERRWQDMGSPGAFAFGKIRRLFEEWTTLAAKNGWLRLSAMFENGEPIAVTLAERLGDTTYLHITGFDPKHRSKSLGSVMIAHTIQTAIEEGCRWYDFTIGDAPYKRRWKPQHELNNMAWRITAPSLRGRAAHTWYEHYLPKAISLRRRLRMMLPSRSN